MELSVLIEVGEDIGALSTVALCLLTAAVGLSLIRMQGLKVIADMQQASMSGTPMVEHLVHGFFLLIAGVLLFFPGFITDALGALLLIPPLRLMLGRAGLAHAAARSSTGFYTAKHSHGDNDGVRKTTIIVEGEYWDAETPSHKTISPSQQDSDQSETNEESDKTRN